MPGGVSLIRESIVFSFLHKLSGGYLRFEQSLVCAWKNSRLSCFCGRCCIRIKYYYMHSALNAKYKAISLVCNPDNNYAYNIASESLSLRQFLRLSRKYIGRLKTDVKGSFLNGTFMKAAEYFCFSPLKSFGIVLMTAVLTNIIFNILLRKEISLFGLAARVVFIFLGLVIFFCRANLQELISASFVLNNGRKNKNIARNRPA